MMTSISSKIRDALSGSVLIISIFAVILLIINQTNTFKNQKIVDTITTEYSIISLSSNLVSQYNNISKNPENKQILATYKSTKSTLQNVFTALDVKITNPESKVLLNGLKNTVGQVITECDTGIAEIQDGNLLNTSDRFLAATTKNDFVRENTGVLLQKELEFLSLTQAKSKNIYTLSMIISSSVFSLIFVILLVFSNSFSKQIILPINQLTDTAKLVAAGEINVDIDPKLLNSTDEIGIFTKSLATMLGTIKSKIAELKELNEITTRSKEELRLGNEKLSKLNSFMVNRELKMVELKKKIAELEKVSTTHEN